MRAEDYTLEELKQIQSDCSRLRGGLMWVAYTSQLRKYAGKYEKDIRNPEVPIEQIRYSQGVLAGIDHANVVLEQMEKYVRRHLARAAKGD